MEGEFKADDAAVQDARLALADLVRDDIILDHTDTPEEIEIVNKQGTVMMTVTLKDKEAG